MLENHPWFDARNLPKISCKNSMLQIPQKNSYWISPNNFSLHRRFSKSLNAHRACTIRTPGRNFSYWFHQKFISEINPLWHVSLRVLSAETVASSLVMPLIWPHSNIAVDVRGPMFGRFSFPSHYLLDCRLPPGPLPLPMKSSGTLP